MPTPSKSKKFLYSTIGGIGLLAGATTVAAAATNQAPAPPTTVAADASTSTEAPEANDANEKENDAKEQADLAAKASISEQQASDAATKEVPGTVAKIELDDEDGTVAYEVEITGADGVNHEVLVNANDSSIISTEVDDEANEGPETGEANETGTEANETGQEAPTSTTK